MTALEAAIAREVVPGTNAYGNRRWALALAAELNATGRGEFVVEYSASRAATNLSNQRDFSVVVLKRDG